MLFNLFGSLLGRIKSVIPLASSGKGLLSGGEDVQDSDFIPYSQTGSVNLSIPDDMVGREQEAAALKKLLKSKAVVFLHGEARVGKTNLLQLVAQQWKESGRPFLYNCPTERDIGDFFEKLGKFMEANGQSEFAVEIMRHWFLSSLKRTSISSFWISLSG